MNESLEEYTISSGPIQDKGGNIFYYIKQDKHNK